MKKLITGIATMAVIISVSSTTVLAAGGGRGRNFVDNDNDGVCDYYNTACQFVDNDGDGICDNYNSNVCGNGTGNGSGFRRGRCGGQSRHCR